MNENTGKLYGYIRVSTKEQNEDRKRLAMYEFGIADRELYMDKQSGKDFERPNYKKLIRKLKPGDALVIKSIDRLGRNHEEILEQRRHHQSPSGRNQQDRQSDARRAHHETQRRQVQSHGNRAHSA